MRPPVEEESTSLAAGSNHHQHHLHTIDGPMGTHVEGLHPSAATTTAGLHRCHGHHHSSSTVATLVRGWGEGVWLRRSTEWGWIPVVVGHRHQSFQIAAQRDCYVGEVGEVGDVQNQLHDLQRKLLILGTCKPNVSTAEEIMNDARFDMKGFTLLDKRAVSEYIKEYVSVLLEVETSDCYFQYLIHLVMGDYIKLNTSPKVLLQILRLQNVFQDLDRSIFECAVEDYVRLCKNNRLSSSEDSKDLLVAILEDDRANEMASVYVDGLCRSLFTTSTRD